MKRTVLTTMMLLALASPVMQAGSFAVNPVRITLDAKDQPVAAISVRNNTDVATIVQADALQWSAAADGDHYQASAELLVTPPVFTLPPNGVQVVRVGLRDRQVHARDTQERSFRLYLAEVPTLPDPDFRGLNVALRLGVPVFVQAPGTSAKLGLDVRSTAPGLLQVSAHNTGTAHVRLNRIEIHDAAGTPLAAMTLARDLLAGQQRQFSLPVADRPGTALTVRIETGEGPQDFVFPPSG